MAGSKKTLNPLTDTPTTKTEVTKPFMIAYMQSSKATAQDIEWFKKIVADGSNQKEYTNRLNGTKYKDIDIPKVRKFFCDRFYPNLNQKKKSKETFIDTILKL